MICPVRVKTKTDWVSVICPGRVKAKTDGSAWSVRVGLMQRLMGQRDLSE